MSNLGRPCRLLKDMTEPELANHLNHVLRFIKANQTPDTVGSMLIVFQDNGITQYGATVDQETAPQALRELADRIERRMTVQRTPQEQAAWKRAGL
jgi:NAD(P)H-dependent FMN reductase